MLSPTESPPTARVPCWPSAQAATASSPLRTQSQWEPHSARSRPPACIRTKAAWRCCCLRFDVSVFVSGDGTYLSVRAFAFPLSSPQVVERIAERHGVNLLKLIRQLIRQWVKGDGDAEGGSAPTAPERNQSPARPASVLGTSRAPTRPHASVASVKFSIGDLSAEPALQEPREGGDEASVFVPCEDEARKAGEEEFQLRIAFVLSSSDASKGSVLPSFGRSCLCGTAVYVRGCCTAPVSLCQAVRGEPRHRGEGCACPVGNGHSDGSRRHSGHRRPVIQHPRACHWRRVQASACWPCGQHLPVSHQAVSS